MNSALLNKEFRPKTDQAKEAVENAVKTLAQQALENTVTVSSDAYRTIQALIAEIDESCRSRSTRSYTTTISRSWKARGTACTTWSTTLETDEMLKIRFMSISSRSWAAR